MREPREVRDTVAPSGASDAPTSRPWPGLGLLLVLLCCVSCGDGHGNHTAATPTPAVTATPLGCPARIALHIDGPAVDLDLGSTGIAYDVPLHAGIVLPLATTCAASAPACDECTLTTAASAPGDRAQRRCANDSRVVCQTNAECESGRCIDLLGPPFGIITGGVAGCTRDELVGVGPGSYAPPSGSLVLPLALRWTFFSGIDVGMPCPTCSGTALGATGTCTGGPHDGESCIVDGTDAIFGSTSYDCSPNPGAELGSFDLAMTLTTGTSRLEPVETCVAPPFEGLACYCPGQTIANFCDDGTCAVGGDGDFVCSQGPLDGTCAREPFRGCFGDANCPADGDHCTFALRPCSSTATAEAGNVGPLERTGAANPEHPLLVAAFCVPASAGAVPNQGLGLPGPAAIRLPVRLEPAP